MARISTVVSENEQKLTDDKQFMVKFASLIAVIVALSGYIILQGLLAVDDLSFGLKEHTSLNNLQMIERDINGNNVNLAVVEDDFNDLSALDLSGIVLASQQAVSSYSEHIEAPSYQRDTVAVAQPEKVKVLISDGASSNSAQNHAAKQKVIISSQDEGEALSFIKKKFYATNNAVFSMKLAKKFYEAKKYDQALKWVLITNEINTNSEESWIMFAKIKEKMGKRQDAINALNEYLKHENSPKALQVLADLQASA